MTGYQSKKAAAQDKLLDDDDTQVYKDHGDALTAAYMSGYHDGKKAAQPEQEPIEAWPCIIETADFEENTVTLTMQCTNYKVSAGKHWLSTNTLQRTWVSLTDEEIWALHDGYLNPVEFVRAVLAKLKEKNNG